MELDQLKQHKRALVLGAGAGLLALFWLTRKPVSAGAFSGPTGDTTGTLATGTDAAPAGFPYMGPGSQGSGSWPDWAEAPNGVAGPANNPGGNGTNSPDFGGWPSSGEFGSTDAPAPGASSFDLYTYLIQQPAASAVIPGYNSVADVPQLESVTSTSSQQLGFNQVTGEVSAGSWQGGTWVPATDAATATSVAATPRGTLN